MALEAIKRILPTGQDLPDDTWRRRHAALLVVLALHVPLLLVMAISRGFGVEHALLESSIPLALVVAGTITRFSRRVRGGACVVGLLSCSALLVHLTGGLVEMHFHFFIVVGMLTLYEDWPLFLGAIGFVLLHHGVMGTLDPASVYNHPAALAHPWKWALVHALFVLGASVVSVIAWKLNEESRRSLRQVSAMKDEFLSAVSHELRTPLTVVRGVNMTLLDRWERLPESERLDLIRRGDKNARRLETLLADLLDLDRLGRQILTPIRRFTDIGALCRSSADVVRDISQRSFDVDVSSLRADIDAPKVERIVENLLINAVKYTATGTRISLRVVTQDDGILIKVSDEGSGVPDEYKNAIFEPFNRGDAPRSWTPGTGIGLTLVRRFAELHGGWATVEDSPSGGACFLVFLPCAVIAPTSASEISA